MSSSLFGQAGENPSGNEESIIKTLRYIDEQSLPLVKKLEIISFFLLPQLDEFMANGGDKKIATEAAAIYEAITVLGEADFAMAGAVVQGLEREKVEEFVNKVLADVNYENALKTAQSSKDIALSLTEKKYKALSAVFNAILPPGFRAFMDIVRGQDKRSVADQSKRWFKKVRESSVEELAQDRIEAAQRFPVDTVVDCIMELAQKTSPERLATMASFFTKKVATANIEQLGLNGIAFALDFMRAATHSNPFNMTYSTRGGIFRAQLKHILNVVEEAFTEAGLTLDNSKLKAALDQARRKPAGGDGGPTDPAPFGT